ncbi:MAG: AmmeMemoRadiSam system protein B [Deltaproteobacteria bacterium]|nr:AmmeMemoRadiSam system protein B [Deltaproteobacteria bacterium]
MLRNPVVAGQFYPADCRELERLVRAYLKPCSPGLEALALVVPHAGYVYSGAIAGETFARAKIPERVVLLGPNHTGRGRPLAVFPSGAWRTPLADTPVDAALSQLIVSRCAGAEADESAHRFEHSLEVQLPFIQILAPECQIVPICVGGGSAAELVHFGQDLAAVISGYPHQTLLVVSSDMTHYEPGPDAEKKDRKAIDRILSLDPAGLYQTVRGGSISMCGVLPTTVMLAAARELGATRGTLVHYGSSGDITRDYSQVVGYAGVIIE